MNNYIVTFEYRVMVTAFAILAMFLIQHFRISNQPASLDSRSHRVECSPPDPVFAHGWHIGQFSATDYGTQFGSEVGLWSV